MLKKGCLKAICIILSVTTLIISLSALALPAKALNYVKGANNMSESYKDSVYYDRLCALTLTGDERTDVVAVALSQLGYREGDANGEFSGLIEGSGNFTEYNYNMGDWGIGYGGDSYSWCASFVSFCLLQSGATDHSKISDWCRSHEGDANYIWREVSCQKWAAQLRSFEYFKDSASRGGDYTPSSGDLIFFSNKADGTESHIGIVVKTDDTYVYTVEGNTSAASGLEANGEGVHFKAHELNSTYIRGYGILPYDTKAEAVKVDFSAPDLCAGLAVSIGTLPVYETAESDTPVFQLPIYSDFEIISAPESSRMKILTTHKEKPFIGYTENQPEKALQVYLSENNPDIEIFNKAEGYTAGAVEQYGIASFPAEQKPSMAFLPEAGELSVGGWLGFEGKVLLVGYYLDSNPDNIVWCTDAIIQPSKEKLDAGGENAIGYCIKLPMDKVALGEHTVTFAAHLADTRTVLLDTVAFTKQALAGYIPPKPQISTFSTDSISLVAAEGYEYKMNNSSWQTSNKFTVVNEKADCVFYQRIAATDSTEAGKESESLTITLSELLKTARLEALTLENATLSDEFTPDKLRYTAELTGDGEIKINATAPQGSTLEISDYENLEFDEDGEKIYISVISPYNFKTTYTITVTSPAQETEPQETQPLQKPVYSDEPEKSGCGSTIGAFAVVAITVLGTVAALKKEKDI